MTTGQNADAVTSNATRRHFLLVSISSFGFGAAAAATGLYMWNRFRSPFAPYWDVLERAIPPKGVRTAVSFGDSLQKLIAAGSLDPEKLRSNFKASIGLPSWLDRILEAPSAEPIVLSLETAPYLLSLLWPLGLSTKAKFNDESPLNTVDLPSLASTGGWTLGQEENGSVYFNKVESLRLTDEQERIVLNVAKSVFRPCCDNSTFFQDCNHGSALLGLIELAASQGTPADELYRIALAANSYWFPDQYAKTALYFALFEGKAWDEVDSRLVLGPHYSSLSGWQTNVNDNLRLASFMSRTGKMEQRACAV